MLTRYVDNTFTANFFNTIGVDFKMKTLTLDDQLVRLQIWDTAGQERFQTITSNYYNGAHGILVVYDVTDRESFNAVKRWMAEVKKHTAADVVRLLVGNKSDLAEKREVRTEEGLNLAHFYGVNFIETSAKDAVNVADAFLKLTRAVLEKLDRGAERPSEISQIARSRRTVAGFHCCGG